MNSFAQPYKYHAGFGNTGFLYSDSGRLTLTWSSFDPEYRKIVGNVHPWMLDVEKREALESKLLDAPDGGRWRFTNIARCLGCQSKIGDSILNDIYYFVFENSLQLDEVGPTGGLRRAIRKET